MFAHISPGIVSHKFISFTSDEKYIFMNIKIAAASIFSGLTLPLSFEYIPIYLTQINCGVKSFSSSLAAIVTGLLKFPVHYQPVNI